MPRGEFYETKWRQEIEKLRSKRLNPTLEEWVKFIEDILSYEKEEERIRATMILSSYFMKSKDKKVMDTIAAAQQEILKRL